VNDASPEVSGPWDSYPYSVKRHGVNITNCDSEPIQTPGCIQAHGAMLVLRPNDLTILQASENLEALLGIEPHNVLGKSVRVAIGDDGETRLGIFLSNEPTERNPLYVCTLPPRGDMSPLDLIVHTVDGLVVVEFDATRRSNVVEPDYYALVKKTVARLQKAGSLQSFCDIAVDEFRTITKFDRVMVYRFHADNHGEVVAESKRDDLSPWLGLHYPAEDIPKPARDIFTKIWVRPLPDVEGGLAELVPLVNPDTGKPLNMTYCALRGPSVMYTEYLRNMQVKAGLTMPIRRGEELWGLIACHHYAGPKPVPYQVRAACEFLAQVVSLQYQAAEEREHVHYRLKLDGIHQQLIAQAAQEGGLSAMTDGNPTLLDGLSAGGAALYHQDRWWRVGKTPTDAQLEALGEWFVARPEFESTSHPVYATDALARDYAPAADFADVASGLLAVSLSRGHRNLLLWFRPETIQNVNWGGNPHEKPTVPGPHGPRLTPRASFELFAESVHGRSLPWHVVEVEAVARLRLLVMDLVISRAEHLAELNAKLNERGVALKASEERFRLAAGVARLAVAEIDYANGLIHMSPEAAALFGLPAEPAAIPRATIHALFHPEDRPAIDELIAASHDPAGTGELEMEHRIVRPDGSIRWHGVRKQVFFDDGRPARALLAIFDITARKEAEEQLRRNHETFARLVEDNPFGVYVVDADFRLCQVSQGTRHAFAGILPLLGRDFDEVLRLVWPEAFAAEISARFRHTLWTGERFSSPSTVEQRADIGEVEAYDWRIERLVLPDGRYGVVCYFYDLSERKRWEAALLAKEQDLRSLTDNTPDILTRFDRKLRHVFVNAAVEKVTGRRPDEFIGKTNRELEMPADLCNLWEVTTRDVFESGNERSIDFAYLTPHGTRHYSARLVPEYDKDGAVEFVLVVTRDVTKAWEAEAAVQASEERLARAQRAARVGTWDWDVMSDRTEWTTEAWQLFGRTADTHGPVTQDLWRSCVHPDDRNRVATVIAAALAWGPYRDEYRVRYLDGSDAWLESEGEVVRDVSGRAVRMLGTVRDVTARKLAEEALQQADRRKDEFLATLAHELRNPLAPIRNGLEIMGMMSDDGQDFEQVRTMMQRQISQMVHLVDDLLDVSRVSQGKLVLRRESIELADVLRNAVETSRPLIEASGHELTVVMPNDPVFLDGDATRLGQVFSNLLNNATKYNTPGGRIWLTAEVLHNEVVVRVKDTGIGIPADMLPKIFDMFTQVDRSLEKSQGGLGIGLSLVKRLVELHGGRVVGNSQGKDQGSEFVVCLPILSRQKSGEPQVAVVERSSRKWRMLIVDDNLDAAQSLAMMLKLKGHEVETAHDGLAALSAAEQFRPEMILLDIGLPKMNGYDVCRCIRDQPWSAGMIVIAATGWGQDEDRRRSSEAGFNYHMVKPVDLKNLDNLLIGLGAPTISNRPTGKSSPLRVLVVDDMRDARLMLSTLLKASGHDVQTASEGLTAIALALDFQPHVVLLDNSMPGMSGLEVAKQMRLEPKLKNTILIALTGHGDEADRQRFLEAGFDHHLVKPPDIRVIRELLGSIR
jgi:PAS domain S-box-containing protein